MGNVFGSVAAEEDNFEERTRQFFAFVNEGNIGQLRALVDSLNADELSILVLMNQPDVQNPRTALINAMVHGHIETAVFLLEKGADPHQAVLGQLNGLNMNVTPLWAAVVFANLELCRALIAHGANVESGTDSGESALLCACFKNNLEIATLLVENSANVNLPDTDGITPLIAASFSGQVEVWQRKARPALTARGSVRGSFSPVPPAQFTQIAETLLPSGPGPRE
ncbi:hypothetical protein niasHS_013070 [Heterodera schachtii]|uniref:Ankyrin repeat domain-containing protein n=1 Tax=Heterodera schachtii TaxID=97005 RepID=A0ABD2IEA1_HETSC